MIASNFREKEFLKVTHLSICHVTDTGIFGWLIACYLFPCVCVLQDFSIFLQPINPN